MSCDLFEIDKKDFLTVTCKLSGQILGEKLKNKSAEETCRALENLFLKMGPPLKIISDNGTNFTSRRFKSLMNKYMIEHARCSPHHHAGNRAAEKSVDTLKRMLMKVPTATVEEASWKLNGMVRPGMKSSPMECFFGRRTRSHLPNAFNRECQIVETLYKRIKNQFNIASRRGHFNRDTFGPGDRVRVQDPGTRRWDILGTVKTEIAAGDGSSHSYEAETDDGATLTRNGTHIIHSE